MNLQDIKNNLNPFNAVMRIHGILKLPAMTMKEIGIYKKILMSFPAGQPIRIFEYGMGFSTLYFAEFLREQRRKFYIDSIDNNRQWYQKVGRMVDDRGLKEAVTLHLKEFVPFWEKPGWDWNAMPSCGQFAPQEKAEIDYIEWPLRLQKSYDVVVIDARFRRRCLMAALRSVNPQGFVILHDAQKLHYHDPVALYRYSRFLDSGRYFPLQCQRYQMWLGSIANPAVNQIAEEFEP